MKIPIGYVVRYKKGERFLQKGGGWLGATVYETVNKAERAAKHNWHYYLKTNSDVPYEIHQVFFEVAED